MKTTVCALALGVAACSSTPPPDVPADQTAAEVLDAGRWVDLTYDFDADTVFWPTASPFRLEVVSAERTPDGYYYAANEFSAAEHGGTHLDAPVHFSEGGWTTEQIPLQRLMGPAAVVDVSAAAAEDRDYLVSVADLETWEQAHGPIPEGAILLMRTGWGTHWPDPEAYLGTAERGSAAVAALHFPGIGPSAAQWIVDRGGIDAVGIDTASIDRGQSSLFETHQILLGANIPAFENVAHLDQVPVVGAYVMGLPMRIHHGSGGPLRLVAVLDSTPAP